MAALIPVLVGVGQVTERDPDLDRASSPLDLIEQASRSAFEDAALGASAFAAIEELVVVRGLREGHRNTPRALAERLGAKDAKAWLMPHGGQGPQMLVNHYAEAIAEGEASLVLLAGAEAIASTRKILKRGDKPSWPGHLDSDADLLVADQEMTSAHERAHGMGRPANVYPMFETALRAHYGRGIEEHQRALGELFAPFSRAAAASRYAWLPIERSAEDIARPSASNRVITWPYNRYMNANNTINQGAALVLTSTERARALGIPEAQWVYLHGCAQAAEIDPVSERPTFYESPAIRAVAEETLAMAGLGVDELAHIDLYSCFPSAVQIAADAFGIAHDDPRGLTITGGLPFHGGAGNNYVMNSIAAMVERLRGDRGSFGLVTANGGHLGKQAAGIYSTTPTEGAWKRRDPRETQAKIDAIPHARIDPRPHGPATIEAYSVAFDREGKPERAFILGRVSDAIDPDAPRFLANAVGDAALLEAMTQQEFVGRTGRVEAGEEMNRFVV